MNNKQTARNCLNALNSIMLLDRLEKHPEESTLSPEEREKKIMETRRIFADMCRQAMIMEAFIDHKKLDKEYLSVKRLVDKELQKLLKVKS